MGRKKRHSKPPIPSWVPKGHPHTWNEAQEAEYEARTTGMAYQEWRALDNALWTRQHDPACLQCRRGSTARREPEIIEQQPFTWDGNADTFDVMTWLPTGDWETWSKDEMETFEDLYDRLPDGLQDVVWDEIMRRQDDLYSDDSGKDDRLKELMDRDVHALTDDEYSELDAYLYGYDPQVAAIVSQVVAQGEKAGQTAPVPCDDLCRGPNHPNPMYNDHWYTCPNNVKAVCTCNGPGSPTEKYASHTMTCPARKSGQTSSYVGKTCKHFRDPVALEDGLTIFASAARDAKTLSKDVDTEVDFGVYLYSGWEPSLMVSPGIEVPWQQEWPYKGVFLDWTDYRAPDDDLPIYDVVRWTLDQMQEGAKVETGCLGGHGRTGTFIALLLVAQGVTPPDAVDRVRKDHCEHAIESVSQVEFVREFYREWHGNEEWRKSKTLRKRFDKLAESKYKTTTYKFGGYSNNQNSKKPTGTNIPTTGRVWDRHTRSWVDKKPVEKGGENT